VEEGQTVYVLEPRQRSLLLMHLLVVALDAEGWRMAPQHFEKLRRELGMTPSDVVLRWVRACACAVRGAAASARCCCAQQ
jgi:hypothetical protein